MAEKVLVPDANTVREGIRSSKNDSKEKSSSKDYDNLLATVGGWMEAIASLDEQPELTEKKASLSTRSIETEPPLEDPDVKTSGNVASFIAGFEGFRSTPYNDVGKLAIGYGTKASGPNQKITKEQGSELTTRLKHMIISVDGNSEKSYINNFVDNEFLSRDSLAFRQYLSTITPDVDMSVDILDSNGKKVEVTVPITVRFFWPSAGV